MKVRGFRIELGEIESRLGQYPGVRDAVVIAREDSSGDKRLVAYFTSQEVLRAEQLRGHLSSVLPEYMVPSAYIHLEQLPLTPNGKLDRRSLPAPSDDAYAMHAYEAPRGEIETSLASIWADVLKVDRVGRHDNFFELGGHSLLAIRIVNRVRARLCTEVPMAVLFGTETLLELAHFIATANVETQE